MCDYSLHGLQNRLAVEGERLVAHRFPTNSLGLASPKDLQPPTPALVAPGPKRWWAMVRDWFSIGPEPSVPAVCIPPGAQLVLRDIPVRLQQQLGVGAEEEVTFVQLNASAYAYRDGVRFKNGREILLQNLDVGQPVDVLCLSLREEATEPVELAAASR